MNSKWLIANAHSHFGTTSSNRSVQGHVNRINGAAFESLSSTFLSSQYPASQGWEVRRYEDLGKSNHRTTDLFAYNKEKGKFIPFSCKTNRAEALRQAREHPGMKVLIPQDKWRKGDPPNVIPVRNNRMAAAVIDMAVGAIAQSVLSPHDTALDRELKEAQLNGIRNADKLQAIVKTVTDSHEVTSHWYTFGLTRASSANARVRDTGAQVARVVSQEYEQNFSVMKSLYDARHEADQRKIGELSDKLCEAQVRADRLDSEKHDMVLKVMDQNTELLKILGVQSSSKRKRK